MPTQIHGHDFACIAVLAGTSSPCYASGSEEKVIRILEAPQAFEDTLALGAGDAPHASSGDRSIGGHKQVCSPLCGWYSDVRKIRCRHAGKRQT